MQDKITAQEPDHDIPNDRKDFQWIMNGVRFYWQQAFNSGRSMFSDRSRRFAENAAYRHGKQTTDRYKPKVDCDIEGLGPDETLVNLNYKIVGPGSSFMDIVQGKLAKTGWNIRCDAIDPESDNRRLRYLYENLSAMHSRDEGTFHQLDSILGEDTSTVMDKKLPYDREDLEIEMQTNYKLGTEEAMEEMLEVVFNENKLESKRTRLFDDVNTYGFPGLCVRSDYRGRIKIDRVEPRYAVMDFSNQEDFANTRFAGMLIPMSISELRQDDRGQIGRMYGEDAYKKIQDMAKNGYGQSFNYGTQGYNVFPYDSKQETGVVYVLYLTFYSTNRVGFRSGKEFGREVEIVDKESNKNQKTYRVVYQGKWVVGTQYGYDAQLLQNMPRRKNNRNRLEETELPFFFFAPNLTEGKNTPMIEKMIPLIDEYQIQWLMFQRDVQAASPPGLEIDISALTNIPSGFGGKNFSPLDLIKIRKLTGNLFYSSYDKESGMFIPNQKPVSDSKTNWSDLFTSRLNMMEQLEHKMKRVSGLTDASTSAVEERSAVRNVQYALNVTDNALDKNVRAVRNVMEAMASYVCGMIQNLAQKDQLSDYAEAVGRKNLKILKLTSGISMSDFGVKIIDHPDDAENEQIAALIMEEVRNGVLTSADYVELMRIDNVKVRTTALNKRIDRRRREAQEQQDRAIRMQGEEAVRSAQGAAMMEVQKEQAMLPVVEQQKMIQIQGDAQLAAIKAQLAAGLKEIDGKFEKMLQDLINRGNMEVEEKRSETRIQLEKQKSATSLEKEQIKNNEKK